MHFGTPECPSLLFCQADKTSAEKCQRGPGTQSFESILEVCHTVLIHLVSLDMAHMRQLAESFAAASRLLHHVFSICSRIEAHLVVGCSCPQTWVEPMYDVIWILEGDSRWMSPAISKARTPLPRTAWPGSGVFVCLVDRATKEFSDSFDVWYSTDNLFLWVNYGGPLAYRAYQSITTCQYSMSTWFWLQESVGPAGASMWVVSFCVNLDASWSLDSGEKTK